MRRPLITVDAKIETAYIQLDFMISIPTSAEDTHSTRCDHCMLLPEKMDCTDI